MATSRYSWSGDTATVTLNTEVLDRIVRELPEKTSQAIREIAKTAEGHMKMFAAVDTGAMWNSIGISMNKYGNAKAAAQAAKAANPDVVITPLPEPPNDHTAFVGPQVEYGVYQEFGTYKMAAHPFVMPGIDMAARDFEHVWGKLFK